MFNNCDPKTNGEKLFFDNIKDHIKIIFDVGCRNDSPYLDFKGDVHYFDPAEDFIINLENQTNNNRTSYFNKFGLGEDNKELYYYPKYQSFYDRIIGCKESDAQNKQILLIRKAVDYIKEKNVGKIDFVKIDTEGYEFNVIKGFEDALRSVQIIQFEYGGTFLDNNTKLSEVIEYLQKFGFHKFAYLTHNGTHLINDFTDHYTYCNIVCINQNSDIIPY